MATAFEDLSADQTRRIYRDFLKGIPKRETKRKYAIDDTVYQQVVGLYRKRTHPNDVGGTALGPRDLIASRLETGSRATEGPVQAYSPRDIDHDSAERTHDALVELGETSAAERDAIRAETAKAVEDPEVLNQQAREHAEKVRIAEQAGEAYRALAVRKHYEDFVEEDKKLVEAGKKQNAELAAQEAAYKTRELEERQKQFEQLKKELESKEGAATTPTPLNEEDLDTTTSMQVSENAQEIIDSHKLPDEEIPPPETETPPVLREKMGQPPVEPSAAHGSAPIGPGPAKEPGPLPKPGQSKEGK